MWNDATGAEVRDCRHVSVYTISTDAGPDEAKFGQLVDVELSPHLLCWVIRLFCLQHQIHLIVLKQLVRLGDYWSKLATAVNTWRSPHTTARLHAVWSRLHGPQRAKAVFRRLPPRPLRGRWGCVSACEDHFLRAGYSETSAVLRFHVVARPEETRRNVQPTTQT